MCKEMQNDKKRARTRDEKRGIKRGERKREREQETPLVRLRNNSR